MTEQKQAEMKDIRLSDLQAGDVWYIGEPRRLIKVGVAEKIPSVDVNGVGCEIEGVRVQVTIPNFIIPGFINERQLKGKINLRRSLVAACDNEASCDLIWEEQLAQRMVHPVRFDKKHGGAAFVDTESPANVKQLYSHKQEGRVGMRKHKHFANTGQIHGVKIDLSTVRPDTFIVPDDPIAPIPMYMTTEDARKAELEKAETRGEQMIEVADLPKMIRPKGTVELRGLATAFGIDVRDISGKGSGDKIWARIQEMQAAGVSA